MIRPWLGWALISYLTCRSNRPVLRHPTSDPLPANPSTTRGASRLIKWVTRSASDRRSLGRDAPISRGAPATRGASRLLCPCRHGSVSRKSLPAAASTDFIIVPLGRIGRTILHELPIVPFRIEEVNALAVGVSIGH